MCSKSIMSEVDYSSKSVTYGNRLLDYNNWSANFFNIAVNVIALKAQQFKFCLISIFNDLSVKNSLIKPPKMIKSKLQIETTNWTIVS